MLVFVLHALYSKCLLLFYFFTKLRENRWHQPEKKIVLISQKRLNINEPTCLFGPRYFQYSDSNCSIEQRNVTKLDRYIITSHSVSGSKCSFTSVIYKYHNLYYPTFFLPKICSPCTYYEYITLLNRRRGGGGGRGVTVLVQGKVVILDARANDARNMRSRVAHCKTRESP